MAKNKAKVNKFLTGAITATLVASAVVPVASAADSKAADSKFNDISSYAQSTQDKINALNAQNIINGTSETTFSPTNAIKRGQVVKLLGRYLVESGIAEVPADWNTKQRFTDVPVDFVDADLVENAAIVYDAGVFQGSNGVLNISGEISRQNMALVLDRAAEAITGSSFVDLAAGKDSNVTDINTAKSEARAAIEALNALGISTVEKFNPTNNVSRANFATFLFNAIEVIEDVEEVAPEVVSVSAINGSITVKFTEAPETTPTAADFKVTQTINDAASVAVAPTVIYDAATKTATLTVPTVAQTDVAQNVSYSVTYKELAAKTASFTVAAPAAAAAVVAAGTSADTTVYVYFNQAVDAESATDVGNYRVDRNITVDTDTIVTPSRVTLNTTAVGPYGVGQVATLTFPAGTIATETDDGTVRVANVKSNGVVIPTTTISYGAAAGTTTPDTTAPTFAATTFLSDGISIPAGAVSVNQGKDVALTADPTDAANFVVGAQYRILKSDGTVAVNWTNMDAQNAPFDNVNEPVKATIKTNNLVVGTYTVQVRATDAATNTSLAGAADSTATITVLPAQGDVTAPGAAATTYVNYSNFAVTGARAQGAKTVRVEGSVTDTTNLAAAAPGVAKVEYRVRTYNTVTGAYSTSTNWTSASATDGVWGGELENYFFVTPALTIGSSYVIDVRATDIYGNVGPITQANDGSAPAVENTADTTTTPGLAAPITGTFTIPGDAIAPLGGTVSAQAPFVLGSVGTPSDVRRVQLASTINATDNTVVTGVEFAVYRVNGVGSRELVRNYSSVGVTAVDGNFDSGAEAYTIDYTLPNASGEYVFEVQAIDAAGNRSAITTTTTVTHVLDVDAPTATIVPNTATIDNKHDFIITFNEAVVKSGGGAIDVTDFAIQTALGTVAKDLVGGAGNTTLTPVAGKPNQFVLDIQAADQPFVVAGNVLTIGITAGVVDIEDLAGNAATASYQIKSTDLE